MQIGSYVGAALIIAGFSWLLVRLGLLERAYRVNGIVRQSAATAGDRSLTDLQKEQALRQNSLALFGLFTRITFGLMLALGLPILLVRLLAFTRIWSFEAVIATSVSWPFLLAGFATFIAVLSLQARRGE
jgi:hypothetical protein